MILADWAGRVAAARGWPRALVGTLAGAVAALAMPPYDLLPAFVVAMALAVWLIDGCGDDTGGLEHFRVSSNHGNALSHSSIAFSSREPVSTSLENALGYRLRAAAWTGWCFGFGFFVAGLWWLGAAFLVDNEEFLWALPLGVLGLPAGLALFTALGFALARLLWVRGPARILALALGLGVADFLRGHILTGFPWNAFGMALGDLRYLDQTASLAGLYGLGVVAVAVCAAPAVLATGTTPARRWGPTGLAALALAVMAGFGAWRVPPGPAERVPGVKFRIMQPNLPQDSRGFRPQFAERIMAHYLQLSDGPDRAFSAGDTDITHLVWPESAFPFLLAREPGALAQIAALLPPGTALITGAARAGEALPGETGRRYYNAIHVVGDDGTIVGTYDKVHLVPFGEYLPFGELLQRLGLRQFVHVPGGFTAGTRREALVVRGLPAVAPLVCYEAIFPAEVVPAGPRPGLFLNVTNDAWFGSTPGPKQHFALARLRTIEEGLPLVRSANTGISAVVDPFGRVIASLGQGQEGVVDAPLPYGLQPTIYAKIGNFSFAILITCCLIALVSARRVAA